MLDTTGIDEAALERFEPIGRVEGLQVLRQFMEAGKMTAVIDKTFPSSRVPEAIRYLVEGQRGGGKIVHQLYPR
jgi:NADPH:quinone reductase-like Zn-dependent oxidoreductase